MSNLLNHIEESISGIWENKKYRLALGLDKTFFFEEKKTSEIIDGFYLILQITGNDSPTLRLTEINGKQNDYNIIDLIIFDTLIISNEGSVLRLKNIPPDEYDGDVFNPADN